MSDDHWPDLTQNYTKTTAYEIKTERQYKLI